MTTGEGTAWSRAIEAVLDDDPAGHDLRRSQALWARAVHAEVGDGVRCDDDVLGPARSPAGAVLMRSAVAVGTRDPLRTRDACDVAWRRWTQVDEFGVEAPSVTQDPDPFGYPRVDGSWVLLAFDGREDDEPFPHRARTCLRILVEELRRHGCTPARLSNPMRGPDDEDIDADASGDGPVETASPPPSGHPSVGLRRPAWLPPFHEVARARRGRPTEPVPFVVLAGGHLLAWDPRHGLLRLPRPEPEDQARNVSYGLDDLTADGTYMRYLRYPGPACADQGLARGLLDLRTGVVTLQQFSRTENYVARPSGAVLTAEPPPDDAAPADLHQRLVLTPAPAPAPAPAPGRTPQVLAQHDLLLAGPSGARPAQFSPTGRFLLTSHYRATDSHHYVVCTDVTTRAARRYDGAYIAATAPWSPDETRVLVQRGNTPYVLRLDTGEAIAVATTPIETDEPTSPAPTRALGWLDDDGLLVATRHGRRIRLSYQPTDNGARFPVLDLPTGATQAETLGIALAPDVIRGAPQLVGYWPT